MLSAQDDAARIDTQQDLMRRDPAELDQPSLEINAGDPDLGEINLVRRTPRPKMFMFSTNQNLNYTSNAFLAPSDEQTDFFWNGRFEASFVPYATRNFTPRLTFEHNFFRYDDFSRLDFDSNSLELEVKYDLNRDDSWFIVGSYAAARLYSPRGDTGEFYRYGLLAGSITHRRQLGSSPVYFSGTLGSNFRHGDPSKFDRITLYLNAGFLYSPIEHLQLTAFVRPDAQFYTDDPLDSSRTDFNISAGTAVILTPVEYVSFALTLSVVGNYSSSDPSDYEVFSPSVMVEGRIAF